MGVEFKPPIKGYRDPQTGPVPVPYDALLDLLKGESVDFYPKEFGLNLKQLQSRVSSWLWKVRVYESKARIGPVQCVITTGFSFWNWEYREYVSRKQMSESGTEFVRVWRKK